MGFAAKAPSERSLPFHGSPSLAPDSEPSLADMVERIACLGPSSGAEALRQLRAAFPDSPLTLRVAALQWLLRRQGGSSPSRA